MTELSPRARELIDTARAQTGLPLARRAALKVSVMKALSPASVATTATSSAWAFKVLVFAVLSAAVGVGVRSWHRPIEAAHTPEQPIVPMVPRAEVVAPAALPLPVEPSSAVEVAPHPLKPPARLARPVVVVSSTPAAPPPVEDDVSAEVVALERAVQALAAGRAVEALATAQAALSSNPRGALRPEFMVVEIEALCDLNRLDEALEVEVSMTPEERTPLVRERLRRSCLKLAP